MAKGFQLSKGLLKAISSALHRSNKKAMGKAITLSHDMDSSGSCRRQSFSPTDIERALVTDDLSLGWEPASQMVKARDATQARLREILDPSYEPWEEVNEYSDQYSEMDHSMAYQSDLDFPESSRGELAQVDENHSHACFRFNSAKVKACEGSTGSTLSAGCMSHCELAFPSGGIPGVVESVARSEKVADVGKVLITKPANNVKRPGSIVNCHRKKKVVMG